MHNIFVIEDSSDTSKAFSIAQGVSLTIAASYGFGDLILMANSTQILGQEKVTHSSLRSWTILTVAVYLFV